MEYSSGEASIGARLAVWLQGGAGAQSVPCSRLRLSVPEVGGLRKSVGGATCVLRRLFKAPVGVSSTGVGGWVERASRPRGAPVRGRPLGGGGDRVDHQTRTSSPASRFARWRGQRSSPWA